MFHHPAPYILKNLQLILKCVFLNHLKLIKLAVSLGSTESLAEHPASMTHAGVELEHREAMNITDKLIRLSIGVENVYDLENVIGEALNHV